MSEYKPIAETNLNTVVAEYTSTRVSSGAYESEAELEKKFIALLCEQGYNYLQIHEEKDLIANLRGQLERLNKYKFTDGEWKRFFSACISGAQDGIVEKTRRIQEENVQLLKRDDGTSKNITIFDKKNVHNNSLQVINQYAQGKDKGAKYDNRYDVTILVNGLPLVHVELKRRGVPLREAFNQIERYQRDSFWAGSGLFEYVQMFVISNGTQTKYYSNTTRFNAVRKAKGSAKGKKTSSSFEFTSYWADAKNKVIPDLMDFAQTFFSRHTLLNILAKFCVFTSENMLMVMRPYQITATERILNRIEVAYNNKRCGTKEGGGYIWHTTGSGKTLTSFKTARLATELPYIDKVLFVVDRKDLDYQTMREYDRFEKGAANSNVSTAVLKRQLEDPKARIIITTIQKLARFIEKNKAHEVYKKHVVIIFDECHRSQFGEMHNAITKTFRNYYMFGFTGTPILAANAQISGKRKLFTTEQTFGDKLHAYTIVDAINDKNVLPFRVDYIKTMDKEDDIKDEEVYDIDREKALQAPERISNVVKYILDHFDLKTFRGSASASYDFNVLTNIDTVASAGRKAVEEIKNKQRLNGFNSILAAPSIPAARMYYNEFKRQTADNPAKALKIAIIYSYAANEDEAADTLAEENSEDTSKLDAGSRDFLESAIADYNAMFKTNYDTSSAKFQNYYKDVSLRMKNRELDLLIVVNMFLTGFDAATLNTLWVDKNLKMHGLIQAFSRTNRILNSVKAYGNIVCFRNLQESVDKAIGLFGDKDATGIVLLRKFDDYYHGFEDDKGHHVDGYEEIVQALQNDFPLDKLSSAMGEEDKKEFATLFGAYLRMRNLLSSFDQFRNKELISDLTLQDYKSWYIKYWEEEKKSRELPAKDITDDVVYEIELIKQVEINIDYILLLVEKYHKSNCKDKDVLVTIRKAMGGSIELRSKKELIENFIAQLGEGADVMEDWIKYVAQERKKAVKAIIEEHHLKVQPTLKFLENAFRDGEIKTSGTDIDKILPPMSHFGGARAKKKELVIQELKALLEKFYGIGDEFHADNAADAA